MAGLHCASAGIGKVRGDSSTCNSVAEAEPPETRTWETGCLRLGTYARWPYGDLTTTLSSLPQFQGSDTRHAHIHTASTPNLLSVSTSEYPAKQLDETFTPT